MTFSTFYRSHTCGELRKSHVGERVKLAGWVDRVRDHGRIIFVDLRDHYGIAQIVFDQKSDEKLFAEASKLKPESVVFLHGEVVERSEETVNKNIPTGEIEVRATWLEIDSLVELLPFPINDESVSLPEELRLKYRFLDLRRKILHENIMLRSRIIYEIRTYMYEVGFTEFQTPILTVSSPEGARDYLVPSRLHPGRFYALPQAPQQYKQLIMCAGFDKYFQIAPCFRDEDARADRSPGEFYQLDVEMSFIAQDDLFKVLQGLFEHLTNKISTKKIQQIPFPRITYTDAMNWYGTDKPDIRFDLKAIDVTSLFVDSAFEVFANNTRKGCCIKAIVLENSANEPRGFFDKLDGYARELGSEGLAHLAYKADGLKGRILKFLSEKEVNELKTNLGLKVGDTVFLLAGKWKETCRIAGQLRLHLAQERNLIPKDLLAFCWIVDFPMYEWNEEEHKIEFSHNPFSMPQGGLESLLKKDPLEILAYQYDIVCNGVELSSGAIRNHRPDIMYEAFRIAGYSEEDVEESFGHMLRAFQYGAPPHGGIAPGIDRIVMIYADEPNIREVIMFPMNQKAQELMVGSPAEVSAKQLKELHLKIDVANA
jgi:aspartyl-tRNA synthetase